LYPLYLYADSMNIFAQVYNCSIFSKFPNNRMDFKMPEAEAVARSQRGSMILGHGCLNPLLLADSLP
jgi:hypothetical protein